MFSPLLSTFDINNALFMANMSLLAYSDEAQLRNTFPAEANFHFLAAHQNGYDTEAFVLADETAVIVAFRGTEESTLADWLSNLDNRMFPQFMGNLHQGFWEAQDQIWQPLLEIIQQVRKNNCPIWLTGHSQGGALAVVTARRLAEAGIVAHAIYTFGQPKVGDMLFSSNYEVVLPHKTFRIYNEGDTVPDNPTYLYHVGQAIRLTPEGQAVIEEGTNFLESHDDVAALLDTLFDFASDGMQAHRMAEYIKRLQM